MKRQFGLTLVEVLIAMLLVLAIVGGALAFVARARDAQRAGEALARLEESLDAALTILVDEIRLAGFLGLAPTAATVSGATAIGLPEPAGLKVAGGCGESLAHDLASPWLVVDGGYLAAPSRPLGCRASPRSRTVQGSDTLILRHAAPEAARPVSGRLQIETNLRAAALAADGIGRLGPDSRWHDLEVGVYYLSADSTGRNDWPSLRRKRLVGGTRPAFQDEELVSSISDFQVEIVANQSRILHLTVEAISDVQEASQPGHHRRKRVSRVVELRNGGLTP